MKQAFFENIAIFIMQFLFSGNIYAHNLYDSLLYGNTPISVYYVMTFSVVLTFLFIFCL